MTTLLDRSPTRAAEIESAVKTLLQGIATDYPRLLEHSRRLAGDPQAQHLHGETLD